MSIFDSIKKMTIYEFTAFISTLEWYIANDEYCSLYDDSEKFEEIVKASKNNCNENSKLLESLNKEIES